jgi:predicted oxidoreductase
LNHQAQVNTYDGNGYGIEGLQQYAMKNNIELQAWSPLDKGRFLSIHADSTACEYETSGLLKKVAEKYDVSPSAVALNWVMQVPNGIAPVIGTTNPSRIVALAQALDFDITREEWYSLWITARDKRLP